MTWYDIRQADYDSPWHNVEGVISVMCLSVCLLSSGLTSFVSRLANTQQSRHIEPVLW